MREYAKSKVEQSLSSELISSDKAAFHLLKYRLEKHIGRMHPHEWEKDKIEPKLSDAMNSSNANAAFLFLAFLKKFLIAMIGTTPI